MREDDGGGRSEVSGDELSDDGEELDPRIDRLVRLIARQAARDTMEGCLGHPRHDNGENDDSE